MVASAIASQLSSRRAQACSFRPHSWTHSHDPDRVHSHWRLTGPMAPGEYTYGGLAAGGVAVTAAARPILYGEISDIRHKEPRWPRR
jgi:hypothetical protein